MENKTKWEDEEVRTLFKFVEIKKQEGMPLIKIFEKFGECVGRCKNSVRNYYYNEIINLNNDKVRCKELGIILSNHNAKKHKEFTKQEQQNLIERITTLINNGYSVRKACLTLANGDATQMIRYQNKYRAYLKQKGETKMENVIQMPIKRSIMSDEDIKALFMGILKLVKKQEAEKCKYEYFEKLQSTNQKLKKAMAEIVLKTAQIENMQSKIKLLENKIYDMKQQSALSTIKNLQNSSAGNLIKEFVGKKKESSPISKIM